MEHSFLSFVDGVMSADGRETRRIQLTSFVALVPLLNLLSLVYHLVLFNLPDVETVSEDYSVYLTNYSSSPNAIILLTSNN